MYHLIDYVWCVEKFSQYFEPHEQEVYPLLTSPIFAYKNTRWVLNLYPEGLGDTASQGYISLFIKYVSEDPENINAKVELSLLNNKNERVYCRDTGDHQYQTFIDFGYKQFLKIQDIKDQKDDLVFNGQLKIFARVEFEHATLPSSLTWSNYDLLLFKENFKDLYETKNLCDIIIKIIKKPVNNYIQQNLSCRNSTMTNNILQNNPNNFSTMPNYINSSHYHPYSTNNNNLHHHNYSKLKRPCNKLDITGTSFSTLIDCSKTILPLNSYDDCIKECINCQNECHTNYESKHFLSCNFNSIFHNNNLIKNDNNTNNFEIETFEIKAHKFILASRSGKFRELLKTNLIKLCTLNNIPQTNDCEKSSKTTEGCGSLKCINKNIDNINCNINVQETFNVHNENSTTSSNAEATEVSLSSYPSCSVVSSSSNSSSNKNLCICADTCRKSQLNNSINSLSKPSSSFLSSSSTEERNFESLQMDHIEKNSSNGISQQNQRILVTNDNSEITDLLIIETDRNPKIIEYLIRYMYTGYLETLDSYSKDIYEISKEYKVHGLTNLAREYIIKELNNQNCCDYLVFCVINNDYELNNKIQMYIAENYDTIVKTNAYKQAKRKYRELFENTFNEILKKIPTLNKGHY